MNLFRRLDETQSGAPRREWSYRTVDRLPIFFPTPAYRLIDIPRTCSGASSTPAAAPSASEYCDIPALYGRNPRLKSPQQILAELDELADGGTPSISFRGRQFHRESPGRAGCLATPRRVGSGAATDTVRLSCELTLNVAGSPKILELIREAFMTNVFCGVETVEPDALRAMSKRQNLRTPNCRSVGHDQ